MKKSVLIIDDEINICTSMSFALEDKYDVKTVVNPMEGLNLIKQEYINLCVLDLKIGEYDGLDVLKEIKKIDKSIVVIMMTAYGSIETSVNAIKNGAFTYITKPVNIKELYLVIEQALEFQALNEKIEYLSNALKEKNIYNGIIGRSSLMRNVFNMIEKLKDVDTNVIITGESGTGKELVARAIHYSGKRKKEKFEELNCAAIPEGLLEEELFGHKKGSFTGAIEDKNGKFEIANDGTIFLDEIGDMPLSLQAKLLRVLQEKEYTPIGGTSKKKLNIRVISATNKDLKAMVEKGEFRQDLYFRLNVIEIKLPALRDKKQDLPLLFNHFIKQYNSELNKSIEGLSREAEIKLLNYNYPGNIRELSNIIEYSMVLSGGNIIELDDLPHEVRNYKTSFNTESHFFAEDMIGMTLKDIEKRVIELTLSRNKGRRNITAQILGISEKGLRNKISEYDLK